LFDPVQNTRGVGQPVHLYRFAYLSRVLAYTDNEQPVVYDGVTYLPVPIQRGKIVASARLDKSTLEIRAAKRSTAFIELFKIFPPSDVVSLRVFVTHSSDPDGEAAAIWSGRVISCSWPDNEIVLQCEPISTAFRRGGLRRNYQYGCPHVLYGPHCRANPAPRTIAVQAAAAGGANLTLPAGWNGALAAVKFANGYVRWTRDGLPEQRTILSVAGNVLSLAGVTTGLSPGTWVSVTPGCDHTRNDCKTLFANIDNFGGQPWIPIKNPIGAASPFQ
jgi:uncharacterized phage protein (TIGR02218 family)